MSEGRVAALYFVTHTVAQNEKWLVIFCCFKINYWYLNGFLQSGLLGLNSPFMTPNFKKLVIADHDDGFSDRWRIYNRKVKPDGQPVDTVRRFLNFHELRAGIPITVLIVALKCCDIGFPYNGTFLKIAGEAEAYLRIWKR